MSQIAYAINTPATHLTARAPNRPRVITTNPNAVHGDQNSGGFSPLPGITGIGGLAS